MKKLFWGRKRKETDLSELEGRLSLALKPVMPRPEFVRDLRSQLLSQFNAMEPESKVNSRQWLLVSAAGFLSGILILVLGIRTVVTLLSALGIIHQFKRQIDEKRTNPLHPSL
jgi:hypothetical protein